MKAEVKTAVVNDIRMDYVQFGAGEKDLVILPGLSLRKVTLSASSIVSAYDKIAREFTVTLFDRRDDVCPGYNIRQMADDTAAVMRSLGIEKAHIFGTSQGGLIAQHLALRHPDLCDKLVLGSTFSRSNETIDLVMRTWMKLAGEGKKKELVADLYERIFSERFFTRYKDLLLRMFGDLSDEELARFMIHCPAGLYCDTYDDLPKIKNPTLVIGAYGDRVTTPEASIEIAKRIGCEIYMYDASYGHAVYDEARDYKDRILAFLKQ